VYGVFVYRRDDAELNVVKSSDATTNNGDGDDTAGLFSCQY